MSGRGASGGVVFQAEVGAYAAGLLLSDRPLSRLARPSRIAKKFRFETPSAVDDVLIETQDGEVYVHEADDQPFPNETTVNSPRLPISS